MIKNKDIEIYEALEKEKKRQLEGIELIASENYVSEEVLEAAGSILTNKYAEGYPGHRYYGGCENVDTIESLARQRLLQLFGGDHANVQPHSGSSANMAVYLSVLSPGDTILGMDLAAGGHLTHGAKVSFSGKIFNAVTYGLNEETELIDYDQVAELARKHRPKMIVAGASAYPRAINFERFKKIATEIDAYLFVDMAHIAGLVAAGLHSSPIPYADFVTSTTHKTLRGPRGGIIIAKNRVCETDEKKRTLGELVDKAIFPGIQGGPLEHIIAAKAVCFGEALSPDFGKYAQNVILNNQTMGRVLIEEGFDLVSGGSDNHLQLVKLKKQKISGKEAQEALEEAGITVNKNAIPNDPKPPAETSGIRIGTAAITTRGFNEEDCQMVARLIAKTLRGIGQDSVLAEVKKEVQDICSKYPLPGIGEKMAVG